MPLVHYDSTLERSKILACPPAYGSALGLCPRTRPGEAIILIYK